MMATYECGGFAVGFRCVAVLAFGALLCASELHAGQSNVVPVPRLTIYPGDTIKDEWLVDRDVDPSVPGSRSAFAETRSDLTGKVARRTLLPGLPVPLNAITTPKTITNGAKVRILFAEGGLTITAYGMALQSGGVGDMISVRNLDSGVTVSGSVQSDGSIRVGGG